MKLGLFDKIKAIGGTINKVEEGISTFQALLRGAKALQTADLYHQGHPTLKTIEDQVNALEKTIEDAFSGIVKQVTTAFASIKTQVLAIKKELDDLTAYVKAQAKGGK